VFNPRDFTLIFIDSDNIANVTKLNRVMRRRVLLFIGNGNGVIGYGKGKGDDYESAFDNAFKSLKQNLIMINLSHDWTVCRRLEGRHNDYQIKIFPQPEPNFWGSHTIWHMLVYTGLFHCRFSVVSRKREPYSMIYAFFEAVGKNITLEQQSQMTGYKITEIAHRTNPSKITKVHEVLR